MRDGASFFFAAISLCVCVCVRCLSQKPPKTADGESEQPRISRLINFFLSLHSYVGIKASVCYQFGISQLAFVNRTTSEMKVNSSKSLN